jgi:biopolymer transport protein ExbD
MAVAVGPANGNKKSLDAEINLVPFIDLLSMCICFLLMTAIWVELNSIDVKQALGTEGLAPNVGYDLEVRYTNTSHLQLVTLRGGQTVRSVAIDQNDFEAALMTLGNHVGTFMGVIGGEAEQPKVTARIVPSKDLNYAQLVETLDSLRGNGITEVGVVPVRN